MILLDPSDVDYLNDIRYLIRDGSHIMFSEDVPIPSINAPVRTIAQIIKFVMSSATES